MKITIARVMHFCKAADTLQRFISEQISATAPGEEGGEARSRLRPYVDAVESIQRLANDLQGAEVTVKG